MIFNPWESSENEINLQEKSIAISKLSDMQKELKKRREDSQVNHSPQKNTFESSLTKPISPQSAESSISPIVYNSIILFLLIVIIALLPIVFKNIRSKLSAFLTKDFFLSLLQRTLFVVRLLTSLAAFIFFLYYIFNVIFICQVTPEGTADGFGRLLKGAPFIFQIAGISEWSGLGNFLKDLAISFVSLGIAGVAWPSKRKKDYNKAKPAIDKNPSSIPTPKPLNLSNVKPHYNALTSDGKILSMTEDAVIKYEATVKSKTKPASVIVKVISPVKGFYTTTLERTEENTETIDKWYDKTNNCIYMFAVYKDGKPQFYYCDEEKFAMLKLLSE